MTENFLQRWSRLKRDSPAPAGESRPAPHPSTGASPGGASATLQLPALESLEFSSDFTAFMGNEVEEGLRRVALQRLFNAEHFNAMDGLDVYIDDYNTFEPIGEDFLRNLNQARGLIFDDDQTAPESATASPVAEETPDGGKARSDQSPAPPDMTADKNP